MVLVEVMVVVALASLMLGVVISLLVSLKERDRNIQYHGVRGEQLMRLAETIRSDVRRAAEVSLPAATSLRIVGSGVPEIRYESDGKGCRRVAAVPGQQGMAPELYAIGAARNWTLERDESGQRPLIKITLRLVPTDQARAPVAPLIVYAALGADRPER
jgi:type II secretory pathway component PulJ